VTEKKKKKKTIGFQPQSLSTCRKGGVILGGSGAGGQIDPQKKKKTVTTREEIPSEPLGDKCRQCEMAKEKVQHLRGRGEK